MAFDVAGAAGVMNQTLDNLGYTDYHIDTTSTDTIEAGFNAIGALPPSMVNQILEQANIVLIYKNYGTMFTESNNETRAFWRDAIKQGAGIEDIYHKIIEAENGFWAADFDGSDGDDSLALAIAKDLVSYKPYEVEKKFHTAETKFRLKLSIAEDEISKVFTANGFTNYVNTKMANLQWSAELYLQKLVINAIKKMVSDGKIVYSSGHNVGTIAGVTGLVEALNTTSDAMTKPSSALNYSGIETISDFSDIYLVTTPKYWNRIKSRGYSNAFNLKEYQNNNRVIMLPEGTELGVGLNNKPIGYMLVDRRVIVCALRYWEQMPFVPANTDYKNFFLKIKLLTGYNEFFNAVAFECEAIDDFIDTIKHQFVTVAIDADITATDPDPTIKVNGVDITSYKTVDGLYQITSGSFVEIEVAEDTTCSVYIGSSATPLFTITDSADFYVDDNIKITVSDAE